MSRPPFNRYSYPSDWVDREVIPDVYPRKDDPYQPVEMLTSPVGTPTALPTDGLGSTLGDIYKGNITTPAVRPVVYQKAFNITVPVTDAPIAIQAGTFQCDAILVSVPSTSVNSTFFGYGSNISSTNGGIEVRPGFPQFYSPDNIREIWEIQRVVEELAALMAAMIQIQTGMNPGTIGPFMSPRVVLNAHDYYLVNATGISQNVAVMLFTVPEFQ